MVVSAGKGARRIADAFEARADYAIGGAIACGFWGVPRDTVDVDVTAFAGERDIDGVIAALPSAGCDVDVNAARATAAAEGQIRAFLDGMRVDAFTPSIPFYDTARDRRVRVASFEGRPAWIWSAEVLCVFKLLFFRSKDIVDLERVVAAQPGLDHAFVRAPIAGMVGEADERVKRWDVLVLTFRPT